MYASQSVGLTSLRQMYRCDALRPCQNLKIRHILWLLLLFEIDHWFPLCFLIFLLEDHKVNVEMEYGMLIRTFETSYPLRISDSIVSTVRRNVWRYWCLRISSFGCHENLLNLGPWIAAFQHTILHASVSEFQLLPRWRILRKFLYDMKVRRWGRNHKQKFETFESKVVITVPEQS